MAEITCTANFNQNIESPSFDSKSNSYDLNVVISTTGFGGELKYDLVSGNNVYIDGNTLYVDGGAFGPIAVNVSDGNLKATAETELYGFYAKVYENGDSLKKQYEITRKDYPSVIPKSNDMGKSVSHKTRFDELSKINRERLPK